MALEPITRAEQIMSGEGLTPITREELFLAKAAGMDVDTPEPITRREMFLSQISGGSGGGSSPVVEPLTVTENGTYTAPSGVDGYNPVTVNVAGSGGDEWEEFLIAQIGDDQTFPVTKLPEGVTVIQSSKFAYWTNLNLTSLPDGITHIWGNAFRDCIKLSKLSMPSKLQEISNYAFRNCTGLTEVTFNSKPGFLGGSTFSGCTNLLTINVPWAEGEVSGAPWGATNATIHYNHTEG